MKEVFSCGPIRAGGEEATRTEFESIFVRDNEKFQKIIFAVHLFVKSFGTIRKINIYES